MYLRVAAAHFVLTPVLEIDLVGLHPDLGVSYLDDIVLLPSQKAHSAQCQLEPCQCVGECGGNVFLEALPCELHTQHQPTVEQSTGLTYIEA